VTRASLEFVQLDLLENGDLSIDPEESSRSRDRHTVGSLSDQPDRSTTI